MMAEEFSPEEKLLRLIRGERRQKDKPPAEKTESPKSPPPFPASPAEIPAIKLQSAGKPADDRTRHFKAVNLALVVVLVLIIVFFIFDIVTSKLKPPSERHLVKSGERAAPAAAENVSQPAQPAPFSDYADVGKRELFKPLRADAQERAVSQRASESAQDKLKDLSLIGIVAGEKPQAIIEDKKIQKTYFLNKGQSINQLMVEDILEDRVILDFEGEKLELVL